jgi:hypothetical protein
MFAFRPRPCENHQKHRETRESLASNAGLKDLPCPTYPQFLQEMCQPLGLHPHAEGAMIIAEEVFKVLQGSGLLARGANVLADDQVVVMPEETDEILANPGMG